LYEEIIMKIGIIGAGNIGGTLAGLFSGAGHEVALSNSRGAESLAEFAAVLGPNVSAVSAAEAASFGDVVVEAIPYGRYQSLPVQELAGKILISAANYYPDRDGQIDLGGRAQSELIADYLPETRVVKAFNTIWYRHLAEEADVDLPIGERRVIFLAADDAQAKEIVSGLIREIGFGPLDTGTLAQSKVQEPGSKIYNVDMTVDEAKVVLG
jgi:predicted dinucleotide-binding enzyme